MRKNFFVFGSAKNSGKSLMANFLSAVFDREAVSRVELNNMRKMFCLNQVVGNRVNLAMNMRAETLQHAGLERLPGLPGIILT